MPDGALMPNGALMPDGALPPNGALVPEALTADPAVPLMLAPRWKPEASWEASIALAPGPVAGRGA